MLSTTGSPIASACENDTNDMANMKRIDVLNLNSYPSGTKILKLMINPEISQAILLYPVSTQKFIRLLFRPGIDVNFPVDCAIFAL